MKTREIISAIRKDGWYQIAQKGSHRQFKHPIKSGSVTVPDQGTANSILKQAGLK